MTLSIITSRMFMFGLLLFVQSVNCAFFDLTDVEDPLSLLWHTKDSVSFARSSSCLVQLPDGSRVKGNCKHKTHCFLSGGHSHGPSDCGILSTCCTYEKTCQTWTKAKESYFTSDLDTFSNNCLYVVEVYNDNVCQVRLDFDSFQLSGPQGQVLGMDSAGNNILRRTCTTDYMIIDPDTYNIPHLCGNNDGQHVYIHLNHRKRVELLVHLANRSNIINPENVIPTPHWKIKVTQLECPGFQHFFTKHKNYNPRHDFELLAPEGAIQYFIAPHGRIRSFGYNSAQQQYAYTSGQNYAIAFKKTPSTTCIVFTTVYMKLRQVDNAVTCLDYLYVPELQTNVHGRSGSELCPRVPQNFTFSSNTPGPFYIHFHSNGSYTDVAGLHAFDILYDLTNC